MNCSKEFRVKGKTYLVERTDDRVFVAEEKDVDKQKVVFHGLINDLFIEPHVDLLNKIIDNEASLYCVLIECLNKYSIINSQNEYKNFINQLLISGKSKEDILSLLPDVKGAYYSNFPLDHHFLKFEEVTKKAIRQFLKPIPLENLERERINFLISDWEEHQSKTKIIIKFNSLVVKQNMSSIRIYIANIDLLNEINKQMDIAGYGHYHNILDDGGYILTINL